VILINSHSTPDTQVILINSHSTPDTQVILINSIYYNDEQTVRTVKYLKTVMGAVSGVNMSVVT